jgi:hypothetical protein
MEGERNIKFYLPTSYNSKEAVMTLLKDYTYQYQARDWQDIDRWWKEIGNKTNRREWAADALKIVANNFSNENRMLASSITKNPSLQFFSKDQLISWLTDYGHCDYGQWFLLSMDWCIANMQKDGADGYLARVTLYVMIPDHIKNKLGIPIKISTDRSAGCDGMLFIKDCARNITKWRSSIKNINDDMPIEFFWEFRRFGEIPIRNFTPNRIAP